jgi:hypothetical protein
MKIEQPEHPWTAQWLRAFLLEKGVKKPRAGWDLSDKALMWLAIHIFACAHIHHNPPTPHPTVAVFPGTVTRDAIERVRNGLERRRAEETIQLASWRGHPDTPDDSYVRTELEHVCETINRITVALSVLDDLKPTYRRQSTADDAWHYFAVPLARKFIQEARGCGYSLRLAEKGPAVAYVHAVVPLITREKPPLGRVASFLKSRASEILKG